MLFRLVIPIISVVITLAIIHVYVLEGDGIFLNLLTEFVGIGFTVLYVDWIIKRNEKKRWSEAKGLVRIRVFRFLALLITGIRSSCGMRAPRFHTDSVSNYDQKDMTGFILDYAVNKIGPELEPTLNVMEKDNWNRLIRHLSNMSASVDNLLRTYSRLLSADIVSSLISIQDSLHESMLGYQILPEIVNKVERSEDSLLEKLSSAFIASTAEYLNVILNKSLRLYTNLKSW